MWKYVVIYTFLISSGRKPVMEQYGRFFTDRPAAERYMMNEIVEECVCDSILWKYISKGDMRNGVIIMAELDSIASNKVIKKQ